MNEDERDFAAKLELIEREATLAAEELPPSVVKDRVQHIAVVAQLLKARLDVVSANFVPQPGRERRKG